MLPRTIASFLATTFLSVVMLTYATPAHAVTIFLEDFEDALLDPRVSVQTIGSFPSQPGIKGCTEFGSSRAFGYGRSSCSFNCFDNYTTTFKITLPNPTYIGNISFKEMELYGNWGSYGKIYIDGVSLTSNISDFGRYPNGGQDETYRFRSYPVDLTATMIELKVHDITGTSEIYIDDLEITDSIPPANLTGISVDPTSLVASTDIGDLGNGQETFQVSSFNFTNVNNPNLPQTGVVHFYSRYIGTPETGNPRWEDVTSQITQPWEETSIDPVVRKEHNFSAGKLVLEGAFKESGLQRPPLKQLVNYKVRIEAASGTSIGQFCVRIGYPHGANLQFVPVSLTGSSGSLPFAMGKDTSLYDYAVNSFITAVPIVGSLNKIYSYLDSLFVDHSPGGAMFDYFQGNYYDTIIVVWEQGFPPSTQSFVELELPFSMDTTWFWPPTFYVETTLTTTLWVMETDTSGNIIGPPAFVPNAFRLKEAGVNLKR